MKSLFQAIIGLLVLIFLVSISQTNAVAQPPGPHKESQLLKRIDFNNAYIMGQSIKSGAVYLLKRKKSDIKSMLEYRMNYRDEILEGFNVPANAQKKSETNQSVATTKEQMFSMDLKFRHD